MPPLRDIKYIGCLCSHVKENIINLSGEGVWHEVSTGGKVTGQCMLDGNNKQPSPHTENFEKKPLTKFWRLMSKIHKKNLPRKK